MAMGVDNLHAGVQISVGEVDFFFYLCRELWPYVA